jgi:hypothetical protein
MLLSTLIGNLAFGQSATPAPQVVPLTKGQPAPMDGVELSNAAASANQVKLQQADLTNQENTDLNKAIQFKNLQITDLTNAYTQVGQQRDMFSKEALAENEQLAKQDKDKTLEHILYFGGGAAIVLILDAIVRSATKNNQ